MAHDWRLARSLEVLLRQIDAYEPNRPEGSDGTIGDARHQADPHSDHNPRRDPKDPSGPWVVTAVDITTADFTDLLAEQLRGLGAAGDRRVKYEIYMHEITSAEHRWAWAPYDGRDPHTSHIHLSVSADPDEYDRTDPWPVLDRIHAAAAVPPTPIGDPTMIVVYAHGRATALLVDGHLKVLKDNTETEALRAAGVPVKGLTPEQFDTLDEISKRVS